MQYNRIVLKLGYMALRVVLLPSNKMPDRVNAQLGGVLKARLGAIQVMAQTQKQTQSQQSREKHYGGE